MLSIFASHFYRNIHNNKIYSETRIRLPLLLAFYYAGRFSPKQIEELAIRQIDLDPGIDDKEHAKAMIQEQGFDFSEFEERAHFLDNMLESVRNSQIVLGVDRAFGDIEITRYDISTDTADLLAYVGQKSLEVLHSRSN